MQYRVYDRQKLAYIDGGFVSSYEIDDDYIVNNNSTIQIVQKTIAEVGDIIALIETSGVFHKGVITAVDNEALTISYKSDKELFNDNFLNPLREYFVDDVTIAGKFGMDTVAAIIESFWGKSADSLKNLPLVITVDGDVVDDKGNPKMLWTWSDSSINMTDWLVDLFEKYNVVLSWSVDFNMAETNISARKPRYLVELTANTNKGSLIKDNVEMQVITYTEESLPDATVCHVIEASQETNEVLGTFYLVQDAKGVYNITDDVDSPDRMLPVKTIIVEYDSTKEDTDVTIEDTARSELVPSQYNQAIEIKISADSKMFDFTTAKFGDEYTILPKNNDGVDRKLNSIYTGRKQSNKNKWITLYFGLGRKNYVDLIQIRMRKQRYSVIYNQ